MAGFLAAGAPVFEIRDYMGAESDLLIRSPNAGAALAEVLGNSSVVLMRGHGATAVGRSLPEAVYRAIYTEINARVQLAAASLGRINFLNDREARAIEVATVTQTDRSWNFWKEQARQSRSSFNKSD
jgi:HCOMODA/2-hydroxy-3-carboxy-muconic semialdehyde decarboxylase